jgi:hypothetical protein
MTAPAILEREALEQLQRLLAADPLAADSRLVDIPANKPPWQDTGLRLDRGDLVSTFAVGRVVPIPGLDVWFDPAFQLWGRIGESGQVFRGTRVTNTFTAADHGRLEFGSYFPGEWSDRHGRLAVPADAYRSASGGIVALVVRWARNADPAARLRAHAGEPSGLVAAELDRLVAGAVAPPKGWRYLWYLGDSEIFSPSVDATAPGGIDCRTRADVGILQHDVDLPLTEGTRFQWSWRVDELPSVLPEDTLPTHDYLSIALEFDNGQDLSWYWSSALPVGHSYRCPIPTWTGKETHLVVRSGTAQLGSWLTEQRSVLSDYATAVGSPPQRIVKVWLIAVTLFQRHTGRCAFRDITLTDGHRQIRI